MIRNKVRIVLRSYTRLSNTFKQQTIFLSRDIHLGSRYKSKCRHQSPKYRQFSVGFYTTICLATAYGLYMSIKRFKKSFNDMAYASSSYDDDNKTPSQRFNFIADVVEDAQPAVVHIYFGNKREVHGAGSGFIVSSDGLILTNAHVVLNRDYVNVQLSNGKSYEGRVQAVDRVTDLATVKINETNLSTLKLGNSKKLRAGEWVIAMGSPLSLSNTVTSGIISKVNRDTRDLKMFGQDFDYIQHDAVIIQGNSGGPLVNLDGEAIGINTMKITSGIAFAIPSNIASDFLERARKYSERASSRELSMNQLKPLGVTMLTLTPSIISVCEKRLSNFPENITHGVIIQWIHNNSPAQRAGMLKMDIIIEVNGTKINSVSDIYAAINHSDNFVVTVIRRNGVKKLRFHL